MALLQCPVVESLQLSTIQDALNITIVPNIMEFPLNEWSTVDWFMNFVIAENIIGDIPLEIVSKRSTVYHAQYDDIGKAVACLNI